MNKIDLAQRLKEARLRNGISIEIIAKALSSDALYVQELEEGKKIPSDFELLILDQLYGTHFSKEGKRPVKELLYLWIPALLNFFVLLVVNPFVPVFNFEGKYLSLMKALDVSYNAGKVPDGSIQAIIACLMSFVIFAFLFFIFLLRKRKEIYCAILFTLEFIVFCSTLYPFVFGPYMMAITFVFGVLSFFLIKDKDKIIKG